MYSIQYNTCQPNSMNAQTLNHEIFQVDHSDYALNKLSWTLDRRDAENSIFLKKKMREYAPITKIKGFLKNGMGISYVGIDRYNHFVFSKIATEQDQLNNYKALYMPTKEYYRVAHTLPRHKWGRIQPKGYASLCVFHRPTRHALCQEEYVDIDMCNAQPQIVYEMCRKDGISDSVSALKEYCEDPKKFRKSIMELHNVSYDTAKQLPIRLMFGGCYNKWKTDYDVQDNSKMDLFVKLENQMKMVIDKVYVANPQIERDVMKSNQTKWKDDAQKKRGVMGLWGQTLERFLQETAISYLVENKGFELEDIVPSQDGFMPRKHLWYEGLIEDCEKSILDKYGITMGFLKKPFDEAIEIPDEEFSVEVDGNGRRTYEVVKEEFEVQHSKIINKSLFVKKNGEEFIFMKKGDICSSYEHLQYEEPHEVTDKNGNTNIVWVKLAFLLRWCKDEEIACYDDVGNYPKGTDCPKNILNMWIPFAMEKVVEWEDKPDEKELWLEMLFILCGREQHIYEYLLHWVAQMIVYPETKTNMPIFVSAEGSGKGTFLQLLSSMLGKKKVFETTDPSRDIWGNFNIVMESAFLININEMSKNDSKEASDKIKALITDSALTINKKGLNQYQLQSYHRFIGSTNNFDPIKTSIGDRRKWIIRCSDEKKGDGAWFNALYASLKDVNVIKTMYEYFKSLDDVEEETGVGFLSRFTDKPVPITEFQSNLQQLAISPLILFMKHFIIKRYEMVGECEFSCKMVYNAFEKWKSKYMKEYKLSSSKFSTTLYNLDIIGVTKGRHTKIGNTMYINMEAIKKHFELEILEDFEDMCEHCNKNPCHCMDEDSDEEK
jgi:hypothetical protein